MTAASLSPRSYPLSGKHSHSGNHKVCHFREESQLKANLPEKAFFFFFPKLTLCADLLLGHTAEERVAGVREAPNHSGSSCRRTAAWTNCQPTLQRERYTANKSVTLSVIPVYIESNRSLSLGSSHHGYIGTARGTISQASSQTSLSLGWSLFD